MTIKNVYCIIDKMCKRIQFTSTTEIPIIFDDGLRKMSDFSDCNNSQQSFHVDVKNAQFIAINLTLKIKIN